MVGSTAAAASQPTRELRGVVTTTGVGPLRFGATIAQVRSWAGPPDFSSPPVKSYPVPAHDARSLVLGYECEGFDRHVCHTLFAFVDGRLVNFMTESRLFETSRGAHPGMPAADAARQEPRLTIVHDCPSWKGKKIPALAATVEQRGRVFSLYARTPARRPAFGPHC